MGTQKLTSLHSVLYANWVFLPYRADQKSTSDFVLFQTASYRFFSVLFPKFKRPNPISFHKLAQSNMTFTCGRMEPCLETISCESHV